MEPSLFAVLDPMNLSLPEAIHQVEARPAAYVLRGADGKYLYKGACRNLPERLADHMAGRAARTRNRARGSRDMKVCEETAQATLHP